MPFKIAPTRHHLLRRSAVALAIAAAAGSASAALPQFTLDPSAAGLGSATGPVITADNILVSDYSTVAYTSTGGFTESGLLSFSGAQLAGTTLNIPGLNSSYGLYVQFTAAGTTSAGDPRQVPASGSFTSLDYTLYGYNGLASFAVSGTGSPTTTAANPVALASGSLIEGSVSTFPSLDGSTFTPSAAADLTFNITPGEQGFFASPSPFYNIALTAFTNTTSEVEAFPGGFRISQGGGALNFTSAVPEPETYALLLGGLACLGFVAQRRRTQAD